MIYIENREEFDVRTFDWGERTVARKIFELARNAKRLEALQEAIESQYQNAAYEYRNGMPDSDTIRNFVANSREWILNRIGIDEDGNPTPQTRVFSVSYQFTADGVVEVEATDPYEAARKVYDMEVADINSSMFYAEAEDVKKIKLLECCDMDGEYYPGAIRKLVRNLSKKCKRRKNGKKG